MVGGLQVNLGVEKDPTKAKFGVIFDIDGVFVRGRTPIARAADALKSFIDPKSNEFVVPCLFCTNGFGLKSLKASMLSKILGIKINPEQIVMSQTPLEILDDFHDKCCLVSGPDHDGGAMEVAKNVGFTNIVTIDDIRKAFPYLDCVDKSRWPKEELENATDFPLIEAIVLLGEPVRWETNLQLIIDVLMTHGRPNLEANFAEKQLPVVAVNMDLQWMAKAHNPRFGHGAFLVCLENLYKKISGLELEYAALAGKPSELTYKYSHRVIENMAEEMNLSGIQTVYAIGDNPMTDIYGANVYNRMLEKNRKDSTDSSDKSMDDKTTNLCPELDENAKFEKRINITNSFQKKRCVSFLVCTGVYRPPQVKSCKEKSSASCVDIAQSSTSKSPNCVGTEYGGRKVDHSHRDLPLTDDITQPNYIVNDVKDAIDKICQLEDFCANV